MAGIRREEHETDGPGVRGQLEEALRDALRPLLAVGRKATLNLLDEITDAAVDVLRRRFIVGVRRPRERRQTARALALRLPEVGVQIDKTHKGVTYSVRIVANGVELCEGDGPAERFESLKAVTVRILGYAPSVSGWRYFFGEMSSEEVTARYKRAE